MYFFQVPTPIPVNDVISLATVVAQLPLHAILALGMIVEGYVIKRLWDNLNSLHDKLDACLGTSKEK